MTDKHTQYLKVHTAHAGLRIDTESGLSVLMARVMVYDSMMNPEPPRFQHEEHVIWASCMFDNEPGEINPIKVKMTAHAYAMVLEKNGWVSEDSVG